MRHGVHNEDHEADENLDHDDQDDTTSVHLAASALGRSRPKTTGKIT